MTGGHSSKSYKFVKKVSHPDPNTAEVHFADVDFTLEMTPPILTFSGQDPEPDLQKQQQPNTRGNINNPFATLVLEKNKQTPNAETFVLKETFVNRKTDHVRQNEWHLTAPFSVTTDWIAAIERHGFSLTKAGQLPKLQTFTPQIHFFQKI